MGRVVPFRRRPRELWRPSLARRQRAAKARSPFIALYLLVAVSGLAWLGYDHLALLKGEVTTRLGAEAATIHSGAIGLCGAFAGSTCVVDGDTIEHRGQRIRLADINTPEIGDYRCARELRLGLAARQRLVELMNEGPFEIVAASGRDSDVYGRQLRVLERDGASLGDRLVAEGLAHRWNGYKQNWCG